MFLLASVAVPLKSHQLPDSPVPSPSQSAVPVPDTSASHAYDAQLQNQQIQDTGQHTQTNPAAQANQETTANPGQTTMYPPGYKLAIQEAESIALRNNPQITVGRLQALQAHQYARETRSALMPLVNLNLTAVDADPGSRLAAGYLTNGRMY